MQWWRRLHRCGGSTRTNLAKYLVPLAGSEAQTGAHAAAKIQCTEISRIRSCHARFTARQRQILGLIIEGKLNKQIAAELGLSENTIKVHRHRIMERMEASSVARLVHMVGMMNA